MDSLIVNTDNFKDTLSSLKDNYGDVNTWIIDVETNGLDVYNPDIKLCGIGLTPVTNHNAQDVAPIYYFPVRHEGDTNLETPYVNQLIQFLNDTCHILIGYNVKFDAKFLEKQGMNISDMQMIDVLVMVRMTEATTVNKLSLLDITIKDYGENAGQYDLNTDKILKSNRTDGVRWKDNYSLAPINTLGPYCIEDVNCTKRLYIDRLAKIKQAGMTDLLKLQCKLSKALYDMESRGVAIDNKYAQAANKRILTRLKKLEQRIYDLAKSELGFDKIDFKFNISSPSQIGEIFNKMNVHSPVQTTTGAEAWNEAVLVQVNHPLAGLIRQYRTLNKFNSTYIEPYLEMPVLHTGFKNWGTVTGRLSSSNPNLQNIPRDTIYVADRELDEEQRDEVKGRISAVISSKGGDSTVTLTDDVVDTWSFLGGDKFDVKDKTQIAIRHLFVPRKDYTLMAYDYSQMEVRVFMYYVDNAEMNELMKQDDVDFHGEAAKIAFNMDEDNPEFKFYRQLAKSITFGVIYGIGKDKLAMQLNTSANEAFRYKKTYLENMKGSKEFFNSVVKTIETKGWVRNKYGRIYKVPKDYAYRGVNYLIQGTSADIMSERIVEIHDYLKDKKSNLLLQVHDEVICEIHKSELDEVAPKIKELMKENTLNIPLGVDMEVCKPSWAVKEDYKL